MIVDILNQILHDKGGRKRLIKEFQSIVWNNDKSIELLRNLAYDLDFYEQDELIRAEDVAYYGDERLEYEVKMVIWLLKKSPKKNRR